MKSNTFRTETLYAINFMRAENYAAHYAAREYVKRMDPVRIAYLSAICDQSLPFPLLTAVGSTPCGIISKEVREQVGTQAGLSADLLPLVNPWYLSERGWEGFQILWRNLPHEKSLISGLPVDNLWITTAKTVEKMLIISGKPVDKKVIYPQVNRKNVHIPILLDVLSTTCGEVSKLSTSHVDNFEKRFILRVSSIPDSTGR